MDVGADEARLFADQLANLHGVAGLDNRVGRCANVHGQRDDDGIGLRELLQCQVLGVLLVLHGVHAAIEALIALGPGFGHILLDGVHIDLGVVPQLHGLVQEFLGSALLFQALVDLLPGAVLLGVNFALAVLGAAALAVDQALGAVHNGANAAGDVQIALGAGTAGLLGQGHAMMAHIVQGIGCGENRHICQVCHGLHAQAAGDDHHIFRAFGDCQLFLRLHLVAEEVQLGSSSDVFPLALSDGGKFAALRLFSRAELLEAFVAGHHKKVILPGENAFQLFGAL